jgi:hypothetical protein
MKTILLIIPLFFLMPALAMASNSTNETLFGPCSGTWHGMMPPNCGDYDETNNMNVTQLCRHCGGEGCIAGPFDPPNHLPECPDDA